MAIEPSTDDRRTNQTTNTQEGKKNVSSRKTAKELMDLKAMQDELQAMIDRLTEEIKEYMGDEEDMMAGTFLVTYRPVISFRVDTAALKKELPDVAALYSRRVEARRFQIK